MIDTWMQSLSTVFAQNIWLGPLIAFAGGLLASFTPCCLATIPMVIGYVGGYTNEKKRAFFYSLFFVIGSTIVFVAIGIIAALVGRLFLGTEMYWFLFLGVLMIVMALQSFGIIHIFKPRCGVSPIKDKKGILGAVLVGMATAIFATPCSTPILIAIAALISTGQSIVMGIVMFLFYSLGHGILLIVAGTSVGWAKGIAENPKYEKVGKALNIIFGILLLAFAAYLLYVSISSMISAFGNK